MPIKIPDHLPAARVLESENIFIMTEQRATHQDIRPLQILILKSDAHQKSKPKRSYCAYWETVRCRWTSI